MTSPPTPLLERRGGMNLDDIFLFLPLQHFNFGKQYDKEKMYPYSQITNKSQITNHKSQINHKSNIVNR